MSRSVSVEFEEIGLLLAEPVEYGTEEIGELAYHRFRSFIAAGAPRTVTVTAQAPASWWQHLKQAVAINAATKSITNWATVFGHWLGSKVETETIHAYEEVNRNVCPHFARPSHDRHHFEFLVRGADDEG